MSSIEPIVWDRDHQAVGVAGTRLLPERGGVLTHRNTGLLATAGYGPALGVIQAAWEACRPPYQGALQATARAPSVGAA